MTHANNPFSERILILAPSGRDASVAQAILTDAGLGCVVVETLPALLRALGEVAGAALLTEEAVRTADLSGLSYWLGTQPAWSDLPFVLLTRQGGGPERNPSAARLSKVLGNVIFLERPFHPTTLVSIAQTALRGRRRQYEARARLEDLRASETRLRELNTTLEQRVAQEVGERSAAEEALRQSQKMEAVGQLTGGVAHDFNNLLTIIRSSVDFLRRPNLSEERRRRYVDAVSDTVDRAAKLTGQLLAFARRQALHPEVFDVAARLRDIADMINTVTGNRIRVLTEIADEPCFVRADVSQFETALINMAVNARDAMDGEGTLTLRLNSSPAMPPIRRHAVAAGPFVALSMADSGSGIAPDNLDKIFEPFFTTKEVGKGTGLGLSQVFGFAKQSGGDVSVESAMGKGTTFTLYLPETTPEPLQPLRAETAPPTLHVVAGHHLLVVEDNIEVGRFATQILQDLGYRTTWATNAEDALERLDHTEPGYDAVFSDVVMPGMGGVALAERLRTSHPGLPVLLTSGYSEVLVEESQRGFDLLQKPYSAEQLSRALQGALSRTDPGSR